MVTMNCDLCEARGKELQKVRAALREIVNKRKLDAVAAASMQAIAREALGDG
jgi:hypothetical protein